MQFYKGDAEELKYYNSGKTVMDAMSVAKNEFFNGAFSCFSLGELIWDSNRSPLSKAIPRDIFRESFNAIFETFLEAGSLEGYITIFKKIFGEEVEVAFTIPSPGRLQIAIVATGTVLYDLVAREIIDNHYDYNELIDDELDNIAAQSLKGMESEYEIEQMLFELVPSGIFTEITLTLGT